MKLYVYCLAEEIEALPEPVRGISTAAVRLLGIENLAAVVSDFDADAAPVNRENALCHAAVVRSVFQQTTPLPFRFGTVAGEQQLRNYISARKAALEAKLAHVRDCAEMNVKIIWERTEENLRAFWETNTGQGAGTAFLTEKRRELFGDERRAAQAQEIAKWLHSLVSSLTREEQVTLRPAERLVFTAAYLIERSKIRQFRKKIAEARAARPEFHFLSSGPWPPYSFTNAELEFQLRFGVS